MIAKRKQSPKANRPWYYAPVITIVNTDKRMLDFVVSRYEGHIVKRKQEANCKTVYQWFVEVKARNLFLKDILPYLTTKREQAEIVLHFPIYLRYEMGKRSRKEMLEAQIRKQADLFIKVKRLNNY